MTAAERRHLSKFEAALQSRADRLRELAAELRSEETK